MTITTMACFSLIMLYRVWSIESCHCDVTSSVAYIKLPSWITARDVLTPVNRPNAYYNISAANGRAQMKGLCRVVLSLWSHGSGLRQRPTHPVAYKQFVNLSVVKS
jgi:hypothetical protein